MNADAEVAHGAAPHEVHYVVAAFADRETAKLVVKSLHAEGFHKRWMGSNEAKRRWCERVSQMEIDMLCPQHGAIYQGADVPRFINWFDELQVGIVGG